MQKFENCPTLSYEKQASAFIWGGAFIGEFTVFFRFLQVPLLENLRYFSDSEKLGNNTIYFVV